MRMRVNQTRQTESQKPGIDGKKIFLHSWYSDKGVCLYHGDCLKIMQEMPQESVDMIFADPPYKLSNGGYTCHSGKRVSVDKGKWDQSEGFEADVEFHSNWINACYRLLKPEGTIWISGTYHSIYQCGYLLQKQGFHLLNDIAWFKPNAAPNLSCRVFAHSHETLLWARKDTKAKHVFNYQNMKTGKFPEDMIKKEDKQMRSIWSIPTSGSKEKLYGKHPTQKPLALLERIVLASTQEEDVVLDPFSGSGTTGLACKNIGRRQYIGIEMEEEYLALTKARWEDSSRTPKFSWE